MSAEYDTETCHCGESVYIHEDGFCRDLCYECDTVRCDVDPSACPATRIPENETQEDR